MNSFELAKLILQMPVDEDSWKIMQEYSDYLIWDEDNSYLERWNSLSKDYISHPVTTHIEDKANKIYLVYKNRKKLILIKNDSEDDLRAIHCLANLVNIDSEIRLCLDSNHSSDKAFITLSSKQWESLTLQFGNDALKNRFFEIHADLNRFFNDAFSEESTKNYRAETQVSEYDKLTSSFENFDRANATWIHVKNNQNQLDFEKIEHLVNKTIFSNSTVLHSHQYGHDIDKTLIKNKKLIKQHLNLLDENVDFAISDTSLLAMVFVDKIGVATTWQHPDKVALKTIKPWWKIW